MNILSFITSLILAAEQIFLPQPSQIATKPEKSFGELTTVQKHVLGLSTLDTTDQVKTTSFGSLKPSTATVSGHTTIALLGDSMTDTLGPEYSELDQMLSEEFPRKTFTILNYGVGASNIDYGIERITTAYDYLGSHIPSLASQKPNIVVVESFGYNPYSYKEGAIDRHWLALAKTVDTLETHIPGVKIIIAATIAPNANTFGDGVKDLAFSAEGKKQLTGTIKEYLESTTRFALGEKLPLADAFHASLLPDGNGDQTFINQGDHIHPSEQGRALFAQKIVWAIAENHLLE